MAYAPIRFDDGAAYEDTMGKWSRIAGGVFLDWLAPEPGLTWADVGCGNGAFTELLVERCQAEKVHAVDPSDGQLAYARTRPSAAKAEFIKGDAMALPLPDRSCDAAVMALVIFFVPDPAKGIAEMVRVVKPGGSVAAYAWDILAGGFPLELIRAELRALGHTPPLPPRADASPIPALHALWADAGLDAIETRSITVERTYDSFDDLWSATTKSPSSGQVIASLDADVRRDLIARVRTQLPADANGRITTSARANAVKGRVLG